MAVVSRSLHRGKCGSRVCVQRPVLSFVVLWVAVPWWEAGVKIQLHFLTCGFPVVTQLLVKKIILSPLNYLGTLLENQLTLYV